MTDLGGPTSYREIKTRPLRVNASVRPLTPIQIGAGRYSEQWLQGLIFQHPECLPVGEMEPAFGELVSAGMEIATPHGPIDNLMITPQGQIVLVEAKLWRNPQSRREVVAQALDYASCLFEWDYEELEQRVLKAGFGSRPRPTSLYGLVENKDGLSLPAFVDAVNANLKRGRILILVVGDGIRTEARRLANLVQSHAGAHFTFALVELSVFEVEGPEDVLVVPRILALTEMLSRGVVEILDERHRAFSAKGAVSMKEAVPATISAMPEGITADEFFEAMTSLMPGLADRLRQFLARLARVGVRADFQRSLNLRWDPPSGRTINLGVIHRDGQVWTDAVNARAPIDLAHAYNEDLAAKLQMEVDKTSFAKEAWHIREQGKAPRITAIADRLQMWAEVIEGFIAAMRQRSEA